MVHKLQDEMFFFNQIARFVDHQYLWKESVGMLDFFAQTLQAGSD